MSLGIVRAQLSGGGTAATAASVGSYLVIGLIGINNPGTPNTQYDLSANSVILRNPSDGTVIVQTNTGVITNNVSTAGPTANGRDQAGAFSSSSWIHFYFIAKDDGTLATLSSATAPPTGPTLPTGYTRWAYAAAIRFDGSSNLVVVRYSGSLGYYETPSTPVNGGTATTATAVDVSSLIPPNAVRYVLTIIPNVFAQAAGTTADLYVSAHSTLSTANYMGHANIVVPVINADARAYLTVLMPNLSQTFYYLVAGTGARSFIILNGYSVPNGDS